MEAEEEVTSVPLLIRRFLSRREEMNGVPYKGYLIRPTPLQLPDSGDWTVELYISKDKGNEINERKYSAGNTFNTKKEAARHCINFGKQIIDGKSPNFTVADL